VLGLDRTGGEAQQEGIEALAGWFQRFARQDQPVASSPAP
jgi:hypothetical protein